MRTEATPTVRAAVRMLAVACASLVALACSDAPEHRIYGRWQQVDGPEVLEFKDDGTVIQADAQGPMFGGTFKFEAPNRIKVSFGGPSDIAPPRRYRIEVTEDSLTVTDPEGKPRRYRRVSG